MSLNKVSSSIAQYPMDTVPNILDDIIAAEQHCNGKLVKNSSGLEKEEEQLMGCLP